MDLKEIKALYKFFKGTDLSELNVEREGGKVKFKRGGEQAPGVESYSRPQAPQPEAEVSEAALASPAAEDNTNMVCSPMVGTFYRAPSPEAPSFVEMGVMVKSGQSLCIIEAMKLMNEVESEFNGKVVDILVENGQPVEYGEPLFKIETGK